MRGGSDTTAATVPFVVQATATTLNGETVPAGVYMADAFIKNGSITTAKIGSLNADKITAGTISADRIGANSLDASKLNIDGATITSNSSGQIVVGSLNASAITAGTVSASVMSGTTVYANKLTGDVNKFITFRTTENTTFAGTETQLYEAQLSATSHLTEGHKVHASVTGWYDSRADKVYRVRMYMRNTVAQSGTSLGTPLTATAGSYGGFISFPPTLTYSGDITGDVSVGTNLTATGKSGTVTAAFVNSSTGATSIFYVVTSGSAFTTSDSISTGFGTSYQLVGESRFKAKTGVAASFAISGGMAVPTTSSAYVKVTIQRYGSSGASADGSTTTDTLGELAGVMMGVR